MQKIASRLAAFFCVRGWSLRHRWRVGLHRSPPGSRLLRHAWWTLLLPARNKIIRALLDCFIEYMYLCNVIWGNPCDGHIANRSVVLWSCNLKPRKFQRKAREKEQPFARYAWTGLYLYLPYKVIPRTPGWRCGAFSSTLLSYMYRTKTSRIS